MRPEPDPQPPQVAAAPPASGPVRSERHDARPGSLLRSLVVVVPGLVWSFVSLLPLLALSYLAPSRVPGKVVATAHRWGRSLAALMGIRIEVHGREHLERPGAAIVLFNHQSLLDLVLLTAVFPENSVVLYKREFHRIPVLGRILRTAGMIPIDRQDITSAIASLDVAARQIVERRAKVLVAPEGTRSRTDGLLPFKRGPFHLALATKAPLVPFVMQGVRALMPPGWWLWRPGVVRIDVLEPIDTRAWHADTVERHLADTRAVFTRYLPPASGT